MAEEVIPIDVLLGIFFYAGSGEIYFLLVKCSLEGWQNFSTIHYCKLLKIFSAVTSGRRGIA